MGTRHIAGRHGRITLVLRPLHEVEKRAFSGPQGFDEPFEPARFVAHEIAEAVADAPVVIKLHPVRLLGAGVGGFALVHHPEIALGIFEAHAQQGRAPGNASKNTIIRK